MLSNEFKPPRSLSTSIKIILALQQQLKLKFSDPESCHRDKQNSSLTGMLLLATHNVSENTLLKNCRHV